MKSNLLVICGALALIVLPSVNAMAGGYKSYPMVCRGGGDMHATLDYLSYPNNTQIKIWFRKARSGAGQSQPNLGECAWLDRPVSASEPSLLIVYSRPIPVSAINLDKSGPKLVYKESEDVQLLQAIQYGRVFYLHAKYRPHIALEVTKIGP